MKTPCSDGQAVDRRYLGRFGEDLTAQWYTAKGFQVLDRNWTCSLGELDIVARRGDLTVFCEVKTRNSDRFGTAAEAVGFQKQARSRRLAAAWFASRAPALPAGTARPSRRGGPVRFDVACVVGGKIDVLEDAF